MAFGLSTLNRPAKAKPYITTKVPLPSERIRRVPIQVRAEAPAETPADVAGGGKGNSRAARISRL